MLIGLTGKAQAGKDTVAAHLVNNYGFTRVAFADSLREMLYALDPIVAEDGLGYIRLVELVDSLGWDEAKQVPEVRALLQRMGTDAVRAQDENFWVRRACEKIVSAGGNVVVTDVRFPNEADAIGFMEGTVVEITRPGAGLAGTNGSHVSESAMERWLDSYFSVQIANDSTLAVLHARVDHLVEVLSAEGVALCDD
jgi:hypothetical protein